MKRKKIIILLSALLVIILCVCAVLFFNSKKKEPEMEAPTNVEAEITPKPEETEKKEQNKVEDDTQKTSQKIPDEVLDEDIIDKTGTYSEEELDVLVKEATAVLDNYYRTMFTFKKGTPDFTDTLLGFFGSGKYFTYNNSNLAANAYREFQGVNMESEYQNYHFNSLKIRENTMTPEISLIGTVQAHFLNDKLEEGDYSVFSSVVLVKVKPEDGWKIYTEAVTNVYPQGGFYMFPSESYEFDGTLGTKGNAVMSWDFSDVEGFLTDYTDGLEWDTSEETIMEYE